MLQGPFKAAAKVLRGCFKGFKGVSRKFLENIKGDERRIKYVSGKCQGYAKSILRVFQESFKCVSRVF